MRVGCACEARWVAFCLKCAVGLKPPCFVLLPDDIIHMGPQSSASTTSATTWTCFRWVSCLDSFQPPNWHVHWGAGAGGVYKRTRPPSAAKFPHLLKEVARVHFCSVQNEKAPPAPQGQPTCTVAVPSPAGRWTTEAAARIQLAPESFAPAGGPSSKLPWPPPLVA